MKVSQRERRLNFWFQFVTSDEEEEENVTRVFLYGYCCCAVAIDVSFSVVIFTQNIWWYVKSAAFSPRYFSFGANRDWSRNNGRERECGTISRGNHIRSENESSLPIYESPENWKVHFLCKCSSRCLHNLCFERGFFVAFRLLSLFISWAYHHNHPLPL